MLDAIAETAAAKNQSKSDSSRQKLAEDLDQFMTLLVTQLKYQDPLDPMDPNEFTSQLVQFASVEQQIHGNANLEQMLDLQKTSLLATVVGYIGAEIDVTGDQMPLLDGKAQADYTLSDDVEDTTITVTDSNDRVVYFTKGEITKRITRFDFIGPNSPLQRSTPMAILSISHTVSRARSPASAWTMVRPSFRWAVQNTKWMMYSPSVRRIKSGFFYRAQLPATN